MFDQFKTLGAMASLMRDQDRLRRIGEELKTKLEALRVEAEAGGGCVRAVASGRLRIVAIEFEPSFAAGLGADERSREMAQTLVCEATNAALEIAEREAQKIVSEVARELGLPELPSVRGLLGA